MTKSRTVRAVAAAVLLAVVAGQAGSLTGLAVKDRPAALYLAKAYTPLHEPQETPLDWFQEPPYVVALVTCAVMLVALRPRPDRRPWFVLLAVVAAWLLWRELPWDERVLNANTFSWVKYLPNADVPIGVRLAFGLGSMAFTLGVGVYVFRRRRALGRLLRERLFAPSTGMALLAGLSLLAAQACDKHRETDRFLGTSLTAWDLKDYLEESLELIGATLLMLACLMAVVEEMTRPDAGLLAGGDRVDRPPGG